MPDKQEKGTVEFDHVSFAYPEAGENVINDITFKAEKGQTVAIIGSTGSGKSTLVNLIPRFYDATKGCVKVDGVDVRNMTQHELRDRLGYVPQKGVLFSGTIDSNIRYGKPDMPEEDVKLAAQIDSLMTLLKRNRKATKHLFPREEIMYPVARSSVFPLQERLPKSRRS